MATGGHAGADQIPHFDGDLFNVVDTVELRTVALQRLGEACERNWRDIRTFDIRDAVREGTGRV